MRDFDTEETFVPFKTKKKIKREKSKVESYKQARKDKQKYRYGE